MLTRKMIQKDYEHCLGVAEKLLGTYFNEAGLTELKQALRSQNGCVALADDTVVGFSTFVYKSATVAELTWLAVAPAHQCQGAGTALLRAVEQEVCVLGIELLEVKTLADTVDYPPYERTRRFYEARGFRLVEVIDPYPGWDEGNPAAVYVKPLEC